MVWITVFLCGMLKMVNADEEILKSFENVCMYMSEDDSEMQKYGPGQLVVTSK